MNESLLKNAIAADVAGTACPALDLAAVRARAASTDRALPPRRNRAWLLAALVIIGPSLAFAASQIIPARVIWLPKGAVMVSSKGTRVYRTATPSELKALLQKAHYHVVPPIGLPAGSKLKGWLMAAGTETFVISYSVPGNGQCCSISFLITPSASAPSPHASPPPGYAIRFVPKSQSRFAQWSAGAERVTVLGYSITSAQLSHIRSAMIAEGKAQVKP